MNTFEYLGNKHVKKNMGKNFFQSMAPPHPKSAHTSDTWRAPCAWNPPRTANTRGSGPRHPTRTVSPTSLKPTFEDLSRNRGTNIHIQMTEKNRNKSPYINSQHKKTTTSGHLDKIRSLPGKKTFLGKPKWPRSK